MAEHVQDNGGPGRLRELLAGREPVIAPGAYDALSARLVEQAGFDAVYMTGFGASASLLGRPDVGLLAFGEMVDQARCLVQAIPAGEMVDKVRAAVEARRSPELIIIARTDARAVEGLDAAIERAAVTARPVPTCFSIVLWPITALLASTRAVQDALARLRAQATPDVSSCFAAFTDVVGLPRTQRLEERVAPHTGLTANFDAGRLRTRCYDFSVHTPSWPVEPSIFLSRPRRSSARSHTTASRSLPPRAG